MQKQFYNVFFSVVFSIVFIVLAMHILVSASTNRDFDFDIYKEQLEIYKKNDETFYETKINVENYLAYVNSEEANNINTSIYSVLPEVKTNISYLSLSEEQIRLASLEVLEYAKHYFNSSEVALLDTVYAVEERVALFTSTPRSYLFYALTNDKEKMIAIKLSPTENSYLIEGLWSLEDSANESFVIEEVNRLMFIYTNKIF